MVISPPFPTGPRDEAANPRLAAGPRRIPGVGASARASRGREDEVRDLPWGTGRDRERGIPAPGGQHEAYLAKELRDFQSGNREGIMVRMARGLSADDIAAIARYYASQPASSPQGPPSELAAVGKFLYHRGNPYSGIPACKGCHGEAAHGSALLPRLAGSTRPTWNGR